VGQSSPEESNSASTATGPFTNDTGLVVVVTSTISYLLFSAADSSRLRSGSISGSSEIIPAADANGGSNTGVAALRFFMNWNPGTPAMLSPITAWSCVASIAMPQLVQTPPEKKMPPDPPLVNVPFSVVPENR